MPTPDLSAATRLALDKLVQDELRSLELGEALDDERLTIYFASLADAAARVGLLQGETQERARCTAIANIIEANLNGLNEAMPPSFGVESYLRIMLKQLAALRLSTEQEK